MGPREVIIFSSVLIVVVSGYCNPDSELDRLNDAIAECESNNSAFFVLRLLKQISDNTLTFERFVEKLHPFCEKPSQMLSCLDENVNVREDCQVYDRLQSAKNSRTMIWYAAEFLCENNATRYLDLAMDDGPFCYANSDLHRKCIFQQKYATIIFNRAPVSNRNVCRLLGVTVACLSTYDNCENQNVRLHIGNLNEYIQSQFGCSKY